jgi:hypothetical protein
VHNANPDAHCDTESDRRRESGRQRWRYRNPHADCQTGPNGHPGADRHTRADLQAGDDDRRLLGRFA